ncbi:glyoxylate bypass operon transcriptional repressor IclR [Arsenophonus sp. aPb]|uniref:glyoxylate bypass operon transcriptional repressor IclR n=1 Tax=Arsenophonus sp. aPb TaxID=3041619 RepID=UPI0024692F17|nr:glyoxylate bypass operon transcriptional repressor IclR [Arsenophonus sp. aPb]WGL98126.1 glyoxylate bypass operon transcriptional repressor IclR [Arsenophonus sp. aPb]
MSKITINNNKRKIKTSNNHLPSASQVQSLSRGLTLLKYISTSVGGVSLTDLAIQAGFANSTTHRLLETLKQHGFIRQIGELGLWVIAANAFIIGSGFLKNRNFLATVHPILRKLMQKSGETVNLAILDRTKYDAVIVDQVQCNALMRMSAPIGGKLPMHASGAGKALLAALPKSQRLSLLEKQKLHAYTPYTLTSPSALEENFSDIRTKGFSYDNQEHALGLRCIGACIYDEYQEVFAAVSISGPSSRITNDRINELGSTILQAAKQISHEYGAIH